MNKMTNKNYEKPKEVRAVMKIVLADTREERRIEELEKRYRMLEKMRKIELAKYVKTSIAAAYLNVDESYLRKRMHQAFQEGVHFFYLPDSKALRWDLGALEDWVRSAADYSFIDGMLSSNRHSDWSNSSIE